MRRLWVPVIGEVICFSIVCFRGDNRVTEVIVVSVYFLSLLSIILIIEGKINERLVYGVGIFAIFACVDELVESFRIRILSELIYKAIFKCSVVIVLLVILLLFQKTKLKIQIKRIWLTIFVILASICVMTNIFVFSSEEYVSQMGKQIIYKIMALIGYGCLIGLISLALYTKEINKKEQELLKREKRINKMQKKYYLSMLEREEETRRYRHDINNHLMYLRELVDGNLDAQNYIDKLQVRLYDIKRKNYETGLEILNILLNNHLSKVAKDISVSIVGKVTAQPDISDVDFCTIFSNLLDNAIEEIGRAKYVNPYIKIEIKNGKMYLMIIIRNSSKVIIEDKVEKIMTKKQDKKNHGIGLENVRETIKRNKGELYLEGNGEEVSAKVILNLKKTVKRVI